MRRLSGEIEDEHDTEADGDSPVAEAEGTWVVPGSFEVSRLRELLEESSEGADAGESVGEDELDGGDEDESLAQLLRKYEATTVGGLVSEMAGHIPLPGEVVEDGPLRLEVIASTDRRVERVRVGLMGFPAGGDAA